VRSGESHINEVTVLSLINPRMYYFEFDREAYYNIIAVWPGKMAITAWYVNQNTGKASSAPAYYNPSVFINK